MESKKQRRNKKIIAIVYLRSESGRSLLREEKIVPLDPSPYLPNPKTIEKAATALSKLGFSIESKGITLLISGSPELFEKTFNVKISVEEKKIEDTMLKTTRSVFIYHSSTPVMQLKELKDIDGVVLSTPGVPLK